MKASSSIHQQTAKRLFGSSAFTGDAPLFDADLAILAFTNRCGSNLLADHLQRSGGFIRMGEFLNADVLERRAEARGLSSFPDYISDLHRECQKDGRVFGTKASADQIAMLSDFGILSMFRAVRVIHAYRNDVISQAVSFSIAAQTLQWTSKQSATSAAQYDFEDTLGRLNGISAENQRIFRVCALLGLPLVSICYEELERRPRVQVRRIFEHFGLEQKFGPLRKPSIQKQRDDTNEAFRARFCDDYLGRYRESSG